MRGYGGEQEHGGRPVLFWQELSVADVRDQTAPGDHVILGRVAQDIEIHMT